MKLINKGLFLKSLFGIIGLVVFFLILNSNINKIKLIIIKILIKFIDVVLIIWIFVKSVIKLIIIMVVFK